MVRDLEPRYRTFLHVEILKEIKKSVKKSKSDSCLRTKMGGGNMIAHVVHEINRLVL